MTTGDHITLPGLTGIVELLNCNMFYVAGARDEEMGRKE